MKPKLRITGEDSSNKAILARAKKSAVSNGLNWPEIEKEATADNCLNLLKVIDRYFETV